MEEQVVLTKTSFEMMKRLFKGKRMKIHELEEDNEKLRKAVEETLAHHAKSKRSKDLIENEGSASSPSSTQELRQRRCSQETVGQGTSAPSIQNRIGVSYKRTTRCSYSTSACSPLVSSGYPAAAAANAACVNGPNSSLNTPPAFPPFHEVHNTPSQISQPLPSSLVQQPNPGLVVGYRAFTETLNKPPPPYQNFPNFHRSSASVSFHSNQTLSYQSSVPVNSCLSSVPVNSNQSSVPVNSHQPSVPANSHQPSVPGNSHQPSVPPNSHRLSVPPNSHQPSVPVNSHRLSVPPNSHQPSVPPNSHQPSVPGNSHQPSLPPNSHQSSVPVNRTQADSQVQHQTFHALLPSHHHHPHPCLPVPNQSHFRNLHHNQPQNFPQTAQQGPSSVLHYHQQTPVQALQNMSSNAPAYHQPEGFMQHQHQTYRTSQLPHPGIQNASPNQAQKHQPPNHAIPRQRLYVRHDLHSDQSFTNNTSQNQSSFGRNPDVLHRTVTNHGYQLSGEQSLQHASTASREGCFRPLWQAASKEASFPNGSFLPENNNFSNVLSHDKEGDTCCIVYESKIVGTNEPHGQSPCTKLQNSSNAYPNTLSGNSYQTDNHGQATITSEPFTCPGPSTVNTKTDSLPPVITPPLTPPTPNSSKPVQLNSDAQSNVTCSLYPNLAPAQNVFTPQPVPLSTGDQPPLNNDSSKVPDQRTKQNIVDMPDSSRDFPSISLGPYNSESGNLPVPLPDIDSDSISQGINNSPKNSDPSISSKEFCLSQSSSFIAEAENDDETTQVSFTSQAVTDTPAKMTLVKDKISNGSSESCGDTQHIRHKEKFDRHPAIPSVNKNAAVTVTSVPSVALMCTGSSAHFNDPESGTTKRGESPLVKSLTEGSNFNFPRVKTNALSKNHEKGYLVSEIGKACIPKSLTTNCYVCRKKDIKGKDVLQHLIFGHLKCKLCNLRIESCLALSDIDKKQPQCAVPRDKPHVFSVWDPNPVDFLSFQIWHFSHNRAEGAPSSQRNTLQMHNYLKMLRPLCNVKPWSSALRMCWRYAEASLKSNPVRSSESDLKTNNDLLSRIVTECEISTEEELNRGTVSSSSEGNLNNAGDMKGNSTDSIKTKSCDISTSDKGEICGGSVDSKVDSVSTTSIVRESSTSLVNSKHSSASPLVVGEAPKGLVIPESCTTSSSVAREGSKEKVKSEAYSTNTIDMTESCKASVHAKDTFVEEEVKFPTSMKGEQIVEEETNDDEFVVGSRDGEFKSVDIIKAAFPEMKETEGSCATMNNEYLLESSCSFEYLDKEIEYVNLLDDVSRSESNGHNSKTLSEDLPRDKINKHIESQGQNSTCIDSCDKNSDFHSKNDIRVDSRTKCDRNSDSQEVTKNEKGKQSDFQVATLNATSEGGSSPCDLPTLNDVPPPPQEASNLHCGANYLIIKPQKDRKTAKYPEECPMCYTVLCPSRIRVNLEIFRLTICCIGCGLLIIIEFDQCNEPCKSEKTIKRPGPKSKTGTGSAKKPNLTN
ncbi:uncharacterized protein LOC135223493 [Macrobrachium nipponense]|uniref:uncharacterized protein LOC135223493 n=1 Tax=Macrobrachium nipponense TaxID=159736 RepID=UPI0030C80CAC